MTTCERNFLYHNSCHTRACRSYVYFSTVLNFLQIWILTLFSCHETTVIDSRFYGRTLYGMPFPPCEEIRSYSGSLPLSFKLRFYIIWTTLCFCLANQKALTGPHFHVLLESESFFPKCYVYSCGVLFMVFCSPSIRCTRNLNILTFVVVTISLLLLIRVCIMTSTSFKRKFWNIQSDIR